MKRKLVGAIAALSLFIGVSASASSPPIRACSDSIDNDSDGLIDYPSDPGCANKNDRDEFNATTPPPPPTGTYLLNEDFSGSTLSPIWKKRWFWGADSWGGTSNAEEQAYRDSQVFLDGNGNLVLRAQRQNTVDTSGVPKTWISGMVQTNGYYGAGWAGYPDDTTNVFAFTYGKIEIRAKIPKGTGTWPGFWLCDAGYPSSCRTEIDILEVVGWAPRTAHFNIHWWNYEPRIDAGSSWTAPSDLGDDYHVYGVEWRQSYIAFFVDGVERWRYTGQGIPSNRHYFIANFTLGGSWPGPTNSTTPSPNDMLIDWIRVTP